MKLCGFDVGLDKPFFLIAGPCVIESMQLQMDVAGKLKEITSQLGIPFIFKRRSGVSRESVSHEDIPASLDTSPTIAAKAAPTGA